MEIQRDSYMKRFVKWDFCLWTHFLSGAGDTGREKGLKCALWKVKRRFRGRNADLFFVNGYGIIFASID